MEEPFKDRSDIGERSFGRDGHLPEVQDSCGPAFTEEELAKWEPLDQLLRAVLGARETQDFNPKSGNATTHSSDTQSLRYQTLRPHAKGGLGQISLALDLELNREVALKEIQTHYADHRESRERFVLEAEITGALEHPGIVPVYGMGIYRDGRPFYAMRFIQGQSLRDALADFHSPTSAPRNSSSEHQFLLRKFLGHFISICNAIEYAHSRGVIHRDLKPDNIMLGQYGETLVVDWGLAKMVGASDLATNESPLRSTSLLPSSGITHPGSAIGTPAYMSPEQAAGRTDEIGRASDVYSLGATLYHVLTGKPPLLDQDAKALIQRAKVGDFPPPRRLDPSIPRALEAICLKATSLNPKARYTSARCLADDIERWMADEPVQAFREGFVASSARWLRKHRAWTTSGVVALGLVSVVATIAAFVVSQQKKLIAQQERAATAHSRRSAALAEEKTKLANEKERYAGLEKLAREKADANSKRAIDEANRADREAKLVREQRSLAVRRLYIAHMNLAQIAWEDGLVGQVIRLLDLYRPVPGAKPVADDLRSFEWFYLDRLCHSDLMTLKGHIGVVASVAFSPDGMLLASASSDGIIKLWSVPEFGLIRTLKGNVGGVLNLSFNSDGIHLLSTGTAGAQLWNVETAEELTGAIPTANLVRGAAYSSDGKRLATSGSSIKIFNTDGMQEIVTLKSDIARSIALNGDGTRLASAHSTLSENTVRIWDVKTATVIFQLSGHQGPITKVAFSPDGRFVASGSEDHTVRIWDSETGQVLQILKGHSGWVFDLSFSPDSRQLATASQDQTVRTWDCETGLERLTIRGHSDFILCVAFSPNGRTLASGSWDRSVKLWDAVRGQESLMLTSPFKSSRTVRFSVDGEILISPKDDKTISLWDASTGQEVQELEGDPTRFYQVIPSADGRWIVALGSGSTVRVWDSRTGKLAATTHVAGRASGIAVSPSSEWIAVATEDALTLLRVTNPKDLRAIAAPKTPLGIHCVCFSPDGRQIALACRDRTVKVWECDSGRLVHTLHGHSSVVFDVAYSPDFRWLASSSWDHTINLWNPVSGLKINGIKGHNKYVGGIAFSSDSQRLASASWDRTVKLWDTETCEECLTLKPQIGQIWWVDFSPRRDRLALANEDGRLVVVDARPWTPELRIEQEAVSIMYFLQQQRKLRLDWHGTIMSDRTISDSVRRKALELAVEWK